MQPIKILLGGSPCTHWSIANKNREVTATGKGWELFKCYLVAKEKFKPDYFLYENNQSAAPAIKEQISRELGYPLHYINSALVSAQQRKRFYVHNLGDIGQPQDRGVVVQDILELDNVKPSNYEFVHLSAYRSYPRNDPTTRRQHLELKHDGKSNALTTVGKDNMVVVPTDIKPDGVYYEVKDGFITTPYTTQKIDLPDGIYNT